MPALFCVCQKCFKSQSILKIILIFVFSKVEKMRLFTDNVVKKYRSRTVVKGVSVSVEQGEIVGLLGPNGAGKTTTFYMMTGLIRPYSGRVFLDDKEITRMPMYKRSQLGRVSGFHCFVGICFVHSAHKQRETEFLYGFYV